MVSYSLFQTSYSLFQISYLLRVSYEKFISVTFTWTELRCSWWCEQMWSARVMLWSYTTTIMWLWEFSEILRQSVIHLYKDLHDLVPYKPSFRVQVDALLARFGCNELCIDIAKFYFRIVDYGCEIDDLIECVLSNAWYVGTWWNTSIVFIDLSDWFVDGL